MPDIIHGVLDCHQWQEMSSPIIAEVLLKLHDVHANEIVPTEIIEEHLFCIHIQACAIPGTQENGLQESEQDMPKRVPLLAEEPHIQDLGRLFVTLLLRARIRLAAQPTWRLELECR